MVYALIFQGSPLWFLEKKIFLNFFPIAKNVNYTLILHGMLIKTFFQANYLWAPKVNFSVIRGAFLLEIHTFLFLQFDELAFQLYQCPQHFSRMWQCGTYRNWHIRALGSTGLRKPHNWVPI